MSTYVLVHGAWGGAHTWKLVRPGLQAAGRQVFTPGLTGIGDRVHLASPQVNLTTHIDDVVNHIRYEDLTDIVLLGFSYGGMVVTGALAHIADRVRHLVVVRLTPHPSKCFSERVRLLQPIEDYAFGRTYVKALDDPRTTGAANPFWDVADRVRDHSSWNYHEVDTNHMIPQNRPAELVGLLLDVVG